MTLQFEFMKKVALEIFEALHGYYGNIRDSIMNLEA
jgi:hypothetical protein